MVSRFATNRGMMSDGTDIAYAVGELRGAAEALSAVRRSADLATTTLQAAVLTPEMFGRTPGAGASTVR